MLIPGILSWATFPGVVIHEMSKEIICNLTGTHVVDVCYLRLNTPAGYVIYERPSSAWRHILIGFGPFLMNTLLGLSVARVVPPLNTVESVEPSAVVFRGLLLWLAVSFATHAFPSTEDAGGIWRGIWKRPSSTMTKVLGTPVAAFMYAGAKGSMFWLNLAYGLAVCLWLPKWLGWV